MAEKAEGRRTRLELWPQTCKRKSQRQNPSSKGEEEGTGTAPWRPPRHERGVRPPRPRRTRPRPISRLGAMRGTREEGRGKAARWIEAERCGRERLIYRTTILKHREAKTTAAINSKTKRRRRLGLQDQNALQRDAPCARHVNSQAFPTRVPETQPAPATRHSGHYYDRSWRRDGSLAEYP